MPAATCCICVSHKVPNFRSYTLSPPCRTTVTHDVKTGRKESLVSVPFVSFTSRIQIWLLLVTEKKSVERAVAPYSPRTGCEFQIFAFIRDPLVLLFGHVFQVKCCEPFIPWDVAVESLRHAVLRSPSSSHQTSVPRLFAFITVQN